MFNNYLKVLFVIVFWNKRQVLLKIKSWEIVAFAYYFAILFFSELYRDRTSVYKDKTEKKVRVWKVL